DRRDRTLIGAVRLKLHGPRTICTWRARKRSPTGTRPLSGRRAVCTFYDGAIPPSAGEVAGGPEGFPTGRCGQDSGAASRCQPAIIAQVRTTSPGTPRSQASRSRTSYSLFNLVCRPAATTARPLRLLRLPRLPRARSRTDPDRGGLPGRPGGDHAPAVVPAAS